MRSAVRADRADRSPRRRAGPVVAAAALTLALAVCFSVGLVALAGPASAHAVFVSASPGPGASLAHPPDRLRIAFSEPLVPALSSVAVQASSGKTVRARSARVDPGEHSAYQVDLPPLRPGRYTVLWHTTSQIDGHSRWGSYAFTVLGPGGVAPPMAATGPPAEPAPLPTPVQAVTSWAGLAGLFLVAGAVLMLLLGGPARVATRRLFARLLVVAGLATLVGVLGQFAATWAGTGWRVSALGSVLGDGVAGWLWLRLAAAAVVLLAWPRRGRGDGAAPRVVLGGGVVAMAVSFAASGHGAASARPVAGAAFLGVHVLAASIWLGGVLGLAIVWAFSRRHGTDVAERRRLLRRFSLVAGLAVPAVAASGAASALLELGSVTDFVRSEYGITLLAKLAIAAAVGAVAVSNVLLHRRGALTAPSRAGRVRTGLWAEAGLGLLVLVPTATMSVLGPSGPADAAHAAARRLQAATDPAAAFTGSGTLHGRGLELSLTPGATGPNAVRAELDGTLPTTRLQVRLTGAGHVVTAQLRRTGYDHDPQPHTVYQGTLALPAAGTWTAVVRGPDGAGSPILVPLRAVPTSTPGGSPPRLDDWLLAIAVLGAAGVAVGAARCVRGRRRRGASLALGGAGAVAALAGMTALWVVLPPGTPAAVASPWGVAHRVAPSPAPGGTTWPVGGPDAGLMMPAVAPDGSVWVGEMETDELARLDPDHNVVQEFALPGGYKEVMGVAVDDDDHVWIAEEHAQALGMFDPATGRYRQYPVPGHDPAPLGVAVDAQGAIWFTMMNGNGIGRFDPRTARFTEYPIPAAHALPYWLAIGPRGQVWFTEFGTGMLGSLDPATGRIGGYPLPLGSTPAGIAVDTSGTVWATTTQGLLVRVDAGTGQLRTFRVPAANGYGVTIGADGTVWLGIASGDAVYSFDPARAAFAAHPLAPGGSPWWVAAGHGRVWAALSSPSGGGLGELGEAS